MPRTHPVHSLCLLPLSLVYQESVPSTHYFFGKAGGPWCAAAAVAVTAVLGAGRHYRRVGRALVQPALLLPRSFAILRLYYNVECAPELSGIVSLSGSGIAGLGTAKLHRATPFSYNSLFPLHRGTRGTITEGLSRHALPQTSLKRAL